MKKNRCAKFVKVSKKKTSQSKYAMCVLHQNNNNVSGIIKLSQQNDSSPVIIDYDIKGLSDGKHGFHIHKYGDLSDNCVSACSHFNPYKKKHGSNDSDERHIGDLGNIKSKKNICKGTIINDTLSLNLKKINCVIGRSFIVHDKEDDLGRGKDLESTLTGNAGKRLACGVIGISSEF